MNNCFDFSADEGQAAAALGMSRYTLKIWRLRGVIPAHCYTKIGYKTIRYNLDLLRDWQQNPTDIAAQARAAEQLQKSLVSNAPKKRGRKNAA
jgi:hypothetical protein